jgi:hypothetical protein
VPLSTGFFAFCFVILCFVVMSARGNPDLSSELSAKSARRELGELFLFTAIADISNASIVDQSRGMSDRANQLGIKQDARVNLVHVLALVNDRRNDGDARDAIPLETGRVWNILDIC